MKKTGKLRLFLTFFICMSLLFTSCGKDIQSSDNEVEATYKNPVFNLHGAADPCVIREDGVYYAFVTGLGNKVLRSENLVDWSDTDCIPFENAPKWGTTPKPNMWAPAVEKINGEFIMYYTLSKWDDPNPGIGYAVSNSPVGKWIDGGKLFLSDEIGVNNSIDADVFKDKDGKLYMVWGSFRGIYGIELNPDGKSLKGGIDGARANKVLIAGLSTEEPFNLGTYEASYVMYRNGYYYLFVSTGTCCQKLSSTYEVRVGRSSNPLGPYYDSQGRSMLGIKKGDLVVTGGNKFVGPGHNTMATDDAGQDWLIYHAWQNINNEPSAYRWLMLDKLIWDEKGWPSVKITYPSVKAEVPKINN